MNKEIKMKVLKNKLIKTRTKEELVEAVILFGNMIFNLIEENKGRYTHDEFFKKYELIANEQTGFKFKYY